MLALSDHAGSLLQRRCYIFGHLVGLLHFRETNTKPVDLLEEFSEWRDQGGYLQPVPVHPMMEGNEERWQQRPQEALLAKEFLYTRKGMQPRCLLLCHLFCRLSQLL